jgi:hypothetical protein
VILNNGSDAAVTFLWPRLGQPGLDRGYNVVEHIPPAMVELFEEENEAPFTANMNAAKAKWSPAMLQEIAWRAKPYGIQPSDYATFMTVEAYELAPKRSESRLGPQD